MGWKQVNGKWVNQPRAQGKIALPLLKSYLHLVNDWESTSKENRQYVQKEIEKSTSPHKAKGQFNFPIIQTIMEGLINMLQPNIHPATYDPQGSPLEEMTQDELREWYGDAYMKQHYPENDKKKEQR